MEVAEKKCIMLSGSVAKGLQGNPPTSSISKSDAAKGIGDLLYRIHSTHTKTPTCSFESTSLQFYEHVVIATVTSKLWCFPKKYQTFIIPRFKIVDAAFSLGPRNIPKIVYFFLLIAFVLIILGAVNGSCTKCKNSNSPSNYFSSSSSDNCDNAGACVSLIIGCLLLIPVPILVLIPFFKKWHFIYLDVKAPASRFLSFGGITSYAFRFTKIGFETSVGNQASFDEFYLIDYVYGSLSKGGGTVTSEAHLLSHFNHAALSTPIVPIHADNSVLDFVADGVKNRKRNNSEVIEYAAV